MSTLRVLSVQHYPVFGGPYNEAIEFEPHLNAAGFETLIAMTDEPGNAASRLDGHVRFVQLPLSRVRWTRDPRTHLRTVAAMHGDIERLRLLIRTEHVDLVKVHGAQNPQGAIAARLEGVPIAWVLSGIVLPAPLRLASMAYVRGLADVLLVNGRGLLRQYPVPATLRDRAFAYYPPVDLERFRPLDDVSIRKVRGELGVPADAPLVGTVANVNPAKGIDVFVRAAAMISAAVPEARFVVVGAIHEAQRAYAERVRALALSLGLGPDVLAFLGERHDVERLVAAFDVKVISSFAEGTTTTAAEAQACAVPVVATDVGAVSESLLDGTTGFLVPPGDPEAIAERVLTLLADSSRRHQMGRRGRAFVAKRFSPEQGARVHVEAYRKALARGVRGQRTGIGSPRGRADSGSSAAGS